MKSRSATTHEIEYTDAEIKEILRQHALTALQLDTKVNAMVYLGPSSGWEDAPMHCTVTVKIEQA